MLRRGVGFVLSIDTEALRDMISVDIGFYPYINDNLISFITFT